jgi:2-polyprenyl-3-methyl-5-hydroxy-6-metoxy-1,4-benzoquinol methylase
VPFSILKQSWEQFGAQNPLWAICTERTVWDEEQFFETGVSEINGVLEYLNALGVSLVWDRALDFGCGVGRLTQALAGHFQSCLGIDIAASMIERARGYNRYGSRCEYRVNQTPDLNQLADNSFDFIYSNIVLQHMEPELSKKYIAEFIRVLKPGGVAVFQIPSETVRPELEPLPEEAFCAHIRLHHPSPITAKAGAQLSITATVQNASPVAWPASNDDSRYYSVFLGSHWLDGDGNRLAEDGKWVTLPTLKPGQQADLTLLAKVPARAGVRLLQLDLVQDRVAWFEDKGCQTTQLVVQVEFEPLPEKAFCARIQPHQPSPITAKAGAQLSITATVQNASPVAWPSSVIGDSKYHPLYLGSHWLDEEGNPRAGDDKWVTLPALEPGQQVDLTLLAKVPPRAGVHRLQLDLVQDEVAWFEDKGCQPAQLVVQVEASDRAPLAGDSSGSAPAKPAAQMEMRTVAKDEVLATIHQSGGRVVDAIVEAGDRAPPAADSSGGAPEEPAAQVEMHTVAKDEVLATNHPSGGRVVDAVVEADDRAPPAGDSSGGAPEEPAAQMEMHTVAKDEVLAIIHQSGGRVVDVMPDYSAGPVFPGFRYCVTKP